VVFKLRRTVEVSKASKVLFTSLIQLGLVYLDLGPALGTTTYTVVDSTDCTDLINVRKTETPSVKPRESKIDL
jgi:hypothetical protein